MSSIEFRAVVKYFVRKKSSVAETYEEMKSVYGDEAPSYSFVKK